MTRTEEIEAKVTRVRQFMAAHGYAAAALGTQANFAWLTAGADNHVGLSSEGGVATVLVTPEARYVVTSNIEEDRIGEEEIEGLGFEPMAHPWYSGGPEDVIRRLTAGGTVVADQALAGVDVRSADLARLRWQLLPAEIERYREGGKLVSRALEETAREVEPGMSEMEIAGRMAGKCMAAGLLLNVCLVAADDRAYSYRHPIPTRRKLEAHLMLVIGARWHGLAISATRMVHFGPVPDELAAKHRAVCAVDACFALAGRPGARAGDVFALACEEYARQGYPDEWRLHHQGGATGYAPRDYKATTDSDEVILEGQAFAWNPSIAGTKSEDTICVTANGPEVLSVPLQWPTAKAGYGGEEFERPAILER